MAEEEIQPFVSAAAAVVGLVLIEWTTGWIAGAAWTQSWRVVKRGHFRITAWIALALSLSLLAISASTASLAFAAIALVYAISQYFGSDRPAILIGLLSTVAGLWALLVSAWLLRGWAPPAAMLQLIAGTVLLGGVINGMMLGHWYLNQPGLQPWALARLSDLSLVGVALSLITGLIAAPKLANASTEGAVLGLPGFGESFGLVFYIAWLVLIVFTGVIVWAARRCVKIRSIQSATGLFYVAVLSAGVAEFVARYLMVNVA